MIDNTTRFIMQNVSTGELVTIDGAQKQTFYVTLQEVDADSALKPNGQSISVTVHRGLADPVIPGTLYDCTLAEVV